MRACLSVHTLCQACVCSAFFTSLWYFKFRVNNHQVLRLSNLTSHNGGMAIARSPFAALFVVSESLTTIINETFLPCHCGPISALKVVSDSVHWAAVADGRNSGMTTLKSTQPRSYS